MNVVDSSGWLEYFGEGTNAHFFEPPLRDAETLVVPTICMYEVFKCILGQRSEEDALRAIGVMSLGVEARLTREIAISAAQISTELKLAMADSIILATARRYSAILWTQDEHFSGLPGVEYVPKK